MASQTSINSIAYSFPITDIASHSKSIFLKQHLVGCIDCHFPQEDYIFLPH